VITRTGFRPATVADLDAARAKREQRRADRAELDAAAGRAVYVPPDGDAGEEDRFPPGVKKIILFRPIQYGDGRACELWAWDCQPCWGPVDAHHRKATGMGGSTADGMHVASNGIAACRGHHSRVHHWVERARKSGLIVLRNSLAVPALVPVRFSPAAQPVLLTDAGGYDLHTEPGEGGEAA
jgi:hypothetical protein